MINTIEFIAKAGNSLPKRLIAVDLACGNGWLGKHLLENNFANYVKFVDARTEWFDKDRLLDSFTNFEFLNVDIEDSTLLEQTLVNCDLIVYFGHLYHSPNPEKILDVISKSSAQYLLLESKIHNIDIGLSSEPLLFSQREPSVQYYNVYNSTGKPTWVKRPNLAFTKGFLENNGWTITNHIGAVQEITLPDNTNTFKVHRYLIFATRNKRP